MDLHIEEDGEGPAVLFIHAGVADSRMWSGQKDLVGYRTITFDKRGYGQTPNPSGPFSDSDDAIAVLDHLGVDSAVVVGCSMGGATALDVAIDHPDRVDALVLVGAFPSGWEPDEWTEEPLEAEAAAAAEKGDFDRVVEIDYLMWVVGYGRDESAVDPAHKQLFFDMDAGPARNEAERSQYQTGFGKRLNNHLDDIDVPTLVVVGAHDEPILIQAAAHLAAKLSDQPAVVIENAAHLPSLEQPDEFNRHLGAFLDSI